MCKGSKKAPASCAGARVVGSPEVVRVENDESTPITSCGQVSLRAPCTQRARETHARAREADHVAGQASCETSGRAPIVQHELSQDGALRETDGKKCFRSHGSWP